MQTPASISPQQERFLAALIQGQGIKAAAAACKINESTGHRWLKQEAFQAAYRKARRQVVDESLAKLQIASSAAVTTLLKNLQGDIGVSASIRRIQLQAASVILEHAVNASEMAMLLERLEQLENRLAHAYEDEFNDVVPAGGTTRNQNGASSTESAAARPVSGD